MLQILEHWLTPLIDVSINSSKYKINLIIKRNFNIKKYDLNLIMKRREHGEIFVLMWKSYLIPKHPPLLFLPDFQGSLTPINHQNTKLKHTQNQTVYIILSSICKLILQFLSNIKKSTLDTNILKK